MQAAAAGLPASCLSCELVTGRLASHGGVIAEDAHFHAHQDAGIALPGFVIITSRRHFRRWDEMTAAEPDSFSAMVPSIRRAQGEALGIDDVYYFLQENTRHHFHLWMLPHHAWMDDFGTPPASLPAVLRHVREQLDAPAYWQVAVEAAASLRGVVRTWITNSGDSA